MEPNERLAAVRDGLTVMYGRVARLIEAQGDLSMMIPGFEWTVREMAVHLAGGTRRYAALANGEYDLSALTFDKKLLDARARGLNADNPETDPKGLAAQVREGFEHFMAVTARVPADTPVSYYNGLRPNVAEIASVLLGEPVIHGYDVATAVGAPWHIDPAYSVLFLAVFQRLGYSALFQPDRAAGLDATYSVDIEGTESAFVRIVDGTCQELPEAAPADCIITADPVTAHLVCTGRISQWQAIALGSLSFSGARPEIGPAFSICSCARSRTGPYPGTEPSAIASCRGILCRRYPSRASPRSCTARRLSPGPRRSRSIRAYHHRVWSCSRTWGSSSACTSAVR
jgi:uncharacterized protein (TIGR03083 family)